MEASNCRLCLEPHKLRKSHIIPEFLFRDLYDDKGRFLVLPASADGRPHFRQKGFYERLLCGECEQRINVYETYVKRVLYDDLPTFTSGEDHRKNRLAGLDYTKFKLFQLSVLWRASISSDPFFSGVQLGAHEESIRSMVWEQNPGRPDPVSYTHLRAHET